MQSFVAALVAALEGLPLAPSGPAPQGAISDGRHEVVEGRQRRSGRAPQCAGRARPSSASGSAAGHSPGAPGAHSPLPRLHSASRVLIDCIPFRPVDVDWPDFLAGSTVGIGGEAIGGQRFWSNSRIRVRVPDFG